MVFIRELRLRWWAFRQFLHELTLADSLDDAVNSFSEEIVGTVLTGHMNSGDLFCLYDEFPELLGIETFGMKRIAQMAAFRLRKAAAMGREGWGSYPQYCRAQEAHLAACDRCRDRLYEEVYEEIRQKENIDSLFRRAGFPRKGA